MVLTAKYQMQNPKNSNKLIVLKALLLKPVTIWKIE